MKYQIDVSQSEVRVMARSPVHDSVTRWPHISGYIQCDAADLRARATAELVVDMTNMDAGNWLKNRKLKKDLQVERYPWARFVLGEVVELSPVGNDKVAATARGSLSWRERGCSIRASGTAQVTECSIRANASFEFDVTQLGVKPPRFWVLKVESIVLVEVTLVAFAS